MEAVHVAAQAALEVGLVRPGDRYAWYASMARLAPSKHNTQPWRFAIVEEGVEIYADYTRRLPHVDPDHRELLMSVGAAIMNLRVAAAHFGFESTIRFHGSERRTEPVALVTLISHR